MSDELTRPNDRQLEAMNLDQLHSLILQLVVDQARNYVLLGKALIRVEKLGGRVREIASNIQPLLRKLASGILIEEAAQHLTSKPSLLRHLSELPQAEQRALLSGEMQVEIVLDIGSDPIKTTGMINLLDVDYQSYRQLFARGRRRPKAEQILWLEQQAKRRPAAPLALPMCEIRERGIAVNAPCVITWGRIEAMLRQHKGERAAR